ncbi:MULTISPECIES: ABC transporter permease [Nocardioides]|uniref:ABC transporter permease n=1 Tax=Nocardioides TaxID=1839 RepID=UPI0020408784|nr:ABC transporter permease [Nocardioides sp. P86]MCM3516657.1 ABC transporter permease [Nocardioides sp. P86]
MTRLPRGLGLERFSGLYLWAVLIVVFSVWQPLYFPTMATVHSIAADRSIAAMLALAILVPLACGAFDLSVGATANISTISAVMLVNDDWAWPTVVVVCTLLGTLIGAVNGFIVVKLKVSSFITTLGTSSMIAAFQIIITDNAQPLPPINASWAAFTQSTILGFQVVVVYMLILAVLLWWVLQHTPVGRYLFAIGSSPEAARLSGARVDLYTWLALIASGTIAGLTGAIYASLAGPSLTYGASLLLPAFAAVFLGSTQVIPGRFNVWGTVLAIFVLATGVKGLQLATNAQWLDPMFSGGALVAAVAVALGRQRAAEEKARRKLVRGEAPRDARVAAAP